MNNQNCTTVLLPDDPSSDDRFKGAHDNVAESIVDLLSTEKRGGRVIGLEGTWGAGKSTVIQFVKQKLEKEGKTGRFSVLLFDTWAHEGDPLRRTFLEKCIKHVSALDWLSEKQKWEKQLLALQGKLKNTTTTTRPKLGWLGLFIALFIIFGPIAIAFANKGLSTTELAGGLSGAFSNPFFLAGVGTYIILIIAMAITAAIHGIDAISVVVSKFENESKTVTIENPDPTSVEFEEIFLELLDDVSKKDKDNKLVLVIDNLDRIEPENALSIISTLQTFLQSPSEDRPYIENVWVIIPYDPIGLRTIWDRSRSGSDLKNNLAGSMITKRFQVRFRVPPLVLSNWKDFMFGLLKKAFPDHEKVHPEDFEKLYATYYRFQSLNGSFTSPTPRELITFVNQVGVVHRRWCGDIQLHHLAYYVLLMAHNPAREFEKELVSGEIFQEGLSKLLDRERAIEDLSSIWFNVEPGLAQELRLAKPLEDALSTADIDKFNQLVANHPGLTDALENFDFDKYVSSKEHETLAKAIGTIVSSSLLAAAKEKGRSVGALVGKLMDAANAVPEWEPFNEEIGRGLAGLCTVSRDSTFARKLLTRVSKNPEGGFAYSKENIGTWCKGVVNIYEAAKEIDPSFAFENNLPIPTDIDGHLVALKVFNESQYGEDLNSSTNVSEKAEAIIARMNELIRDQSQAIVDTSLINALIAVNKSGGAVVKLDAFGEEIVGQLQKDTLDDAVVISRLYEWIEILMNVSVAPADSVNKVVASGFVYRHLSKALKAMDEVLAAKLLFYIILADPAIPQPPVVPESQAGYDLLKEVWKDPTNRFTAVSLKVLNMLTEVGLQNKYFEVLNQNPEARSWAAWSLDRIVAGAKTIDFEIGKIQNHWKALRKGLGLPAFALFVNNEKVRDRLIANVTSSAFSIKHSGLYAALIQKGAGEDQDLIKWLQQNLEKLSIEDWQSNLDGESELVDLVAVLATVSLSFDLDLKYSDALVADMRKRIESGAFPKNEGNWRQLPKALRKRHKQSDFRSNMLTELENFSNQHSGGVPAKFFEIYGPEMLDEKTLLASENLFPRLLTPMLSQPNEAGLKWIVSLVNAFPLFVKKYRKKPGRESEVDVFQDRLKIKFSESGTPDIIKSLIGEIAGKFDVVLDNLIPSVDEGQDQKAE